MNFISHFNNMMDKIYHDKRLNPSHVSLYLAVFEQWNRQYFKNPVSVSRGELMKISKIGSKSTYHKCMKELSKFGFFQYNPSHNPFHGSTINMYNFETSDRQAVNPQYTKNCPTSGQALVSYINNIKQLKHIKQNNNNNELKNDFLENPSKNEVTEFFKIKLFPESEAIRFFSYYQKKNWRTKKNERIDDWQKSALSWMVNSKNYQKNSSQHLKNQDYGEPL